MRVGVNALNVRPEVMDGAATFALNVLAHLPAAMPEAHVIAYVREDEARVPADERLELRPVRLRSGVTGRVAAETLWLGHDLRRRRADVLLSPYEALPWGLRCPAVVVAQNLVYHWPRFGEYLGKSAGERLATRLQAGVYRRRMRAAYRRAHAVAAVSAETAAVLAAEAGLRPDKTTVVHEGADSFLLPEPAARPPARRPVLLAVASLAPHKGLEAVMELFERLAPALPDVTLEIAGADWRGFESVLRGRAGRSPVAGRISFLGAVQGADLARLYETSLALLHFPECESFGLPAVEAMRYRLPVVASRASSTPEIVDGAGLLVDARPADADLARIAHLLHSPQERARLAELGAARAAELSWRDTADGLAGLLRAAATAR